MLYYIIHCTVTHKLHGRHIGYGDNAWPIKCVTVCGDWWLTGPNWNTGPGQSLVASFREAGEWGWNTGAPLKYGISGNLSLRCGWVPGTNIQPLPVPRIVSILNSIEYRDTFARYLSWKKFKVSPIPTLLIDDRSLLVHSTESEL